MHKLWTKERQLWITSDTHYNHKNICLGESDWEAALLDPNHAGLRNFPTLKDMNKALVDGINNHVKENDVLIHLGDFSFGGINSIWEFRKQIKCKEIHLVYGNHDHHIRNNRYLPNCMWQDITKDVYSPITNDHFQVVDRIERKLYEDWRDDLFNVEARDMFASVQDVAYIPVQRCKNSKQEIVFVSHYAHLVWDKSHHGRPHIFGHSHTSMDEFKAGRSFDAGVDEAYKLFGEYRPFNMNEALEITDKLPIKNFDHHNANTN